MTRKSIDRLLAESAQQLPSHDPSVRRSVRELVSELQAAPPKRSPSRLRGLALIVPAVGIGGLALTGGALAVDTALTPDVVIPISYPAADGGMVECSIDVDGGSLFDPASTTVGDSIRGEDGTDLGLQVWTRVIERAPASDEGAGGTEDWITVEIGEIEITEADLDRAVTDVLSGVVAVEGDGSAPIIDDAEWADFQWSSNCTDELP